MVVGHVVFGCYMEEACSLFIYQYLCLCLSVLCSVRDPTTLLFSCKDAIFSTILSMLHLERK